MNGRRNRHGTGDVIHGNKYGGDHVQGVKIVYSSQPSPAQRPVGQRPVIMLMSANSTDRPLRIDLERREISEAGAKAGARGRLELRNADALRLGDLQRTLLAHQPAIAHFSGHGDATQGVMVVDEPIRRDLGENFTAVGSSVRGVPPAALGELFGILPKRPACVVLNACYTHDQAQAIAVHVPCVIGMRGGIEDAAAISFAVGFYEAVAHGASFDTAFALGRNRLALLGHVDAGVPQFIATPAAAGRSIYTSE
jgi:hypothetical protein